MRNRLAAAASPYLRQHADNPVDWFEWSAEALAEAAKRDVPIVLSVGYAACHWCHVMAHDSFQDAEVAALMNEHFVCVKVDREERPDIDAIYMAATGALTGHGGWPMTCFLTPDGHPFYCGTYYPKDEFLQLLSAIVAAWRDDRDDVQRSSATIAAALRASATGKTGLPVIVDASLCDRAVAAVLRDEDVVDGGFGGAPKFPPSMLLESLLRHYERTGRRPVLHTVARAAEAMARGGIYDQLAGGFSRYSVDKAWVVPHFEKMLYDNALLLRAYAHWSRRTGDALATRITAETSHFLLQDLAVDDVFVSSLDADTQGREGAAYVWTPAQLEDVLGAHDGRWAADVFSVTADGTFEAGTSVLQRRADPDDLQRLDSVRRRLLEARRARVQPERDGKVVTAWNGLAIVALVEAAVALDDQRLLLAAQRCARKLIDLHLLDGRLRRSSLGSRVGQSAAILEDYGALATGLLSVFQFTGEGALRDAAAGLLDVALEHFADPHEPGRWFDSADDAEALMLRPCDPSDSATPSGAALITEALLIGAPLVGLDRGERYRRAATQSLMRNGELLQRAPRAGGHWLGVAEAYIRGPLQIAIACEGADSQLLAQARRLAPGGTIVVGGVTGSSELLVGRDRILGADTAYVCRGTVCDLPVRTAAELALALAVPADSPSV